MKVTLKLWPCCFPLIFVLRCSLLTFLLISQKTKNYKQLWLGRCTTNSENKGAWSNKKPVQKRNPVLHSAISLNTIPNYFVPLNDPCSFQIRPFSFLGCGLTNIKDATMNLLARQSLTVNRYCWGQAWMRACHPWYDDPWSSSGMIFPLVVP